MLPSDVIDNWTVEFRLTLGNIRQSWSRPEFAKDYAVRETQAERRPPIVVLDGGPLDGNQFAEIEGDELDIKLSDGQQHRYMRTGNTQKLPDGSHAQVFAWVGRYYGPI